MGFPTHMANTVSYRDTCHLFLSVYVNVFQRKQQCNTDEHFWFDVTLV